MVPNKLPFGKQDFKYYFGYKDSKNSDLYAHSVNKWLHVKEILMKIDVFIFQ